MRSFSSVALLFIFWLAITGTCCAAETQAAAGTPLTPVSTILKPDGSLNLSSGFSGSLDVKGYRMETGANGAPRFVPSAASAESSPKTVQAHATPGPESDADNVYWDDQFPVPGADTAVEAIAIDGSGNVYVGGSFTAVGNMPVGRIAKWNGTSWSALGSGMNSSVCALAVSRNDVYAGGYFTTAGGVSANYIARWDGTSWSAVGGGMNSYVYALAVSGSDVYAGGYFTTAGGVTACYISRWNGTSWSAVGSGMNDGVFALAVNGSDVYAGGCFTYAGGTSAKSIAKWDGTSWSALGSGMNSSVCALAVSGSDVYAGGAFTTAGGNPASHIAKWTGVYWSALGSGISTETYDCVYVLAASGGNIYAGGNFTAAGGKSADCLAKWNGTSWSDIGSSSDSVLALAVCGNNLYAGGMFTTAGYASAYNIAMWNGTSWLALGTGVSSAVWGVVASGNEVYAGGEFTAACGVSAKHIAKWNGASWAALGSGTDMDVLALAVSGSDVYAGGWFHIAGGVSAKYIAKWNGSSWAALGSGMDNVVGALAISGSNVYAGGQFTTAGGVSAKSVAKWDGTSWSALGSGMGGTSPCVMALAVSGSDVYAGGDFTTAGGVSANYIAKWNGTSWSALGSGMNNDVHALAVSGSDVYAGGCFTSAGGVSANYTAKWNGTSWSALGSGMNDRVFALAVSGSNVYAGGDFTTAGGVSANRAAKWDGTSWSPLGCGVNDTVDALAVSGNTLLAGGGFTFAGGEVSCHFAELQPRVDATTVSVSATPGALTIGDSPFGFNRPALITSAGTTANYAGGLPTTVTLDRADEIRIDGKRVNGAFTLSPGGVLFGGDGATIRIEFSEVDVALFGCAFTDFRAVGLTYRAGYPASKEAAGLTLLPGQSPPVPIRIDNGKQIYAITAPLQEISSTYGAVPLSIVERADMALAGSCDPASVMCGQELQHAFRVTNEGFGEATGVVFSDPLPDGCAYVSSAASQGSVGLESGAVVGELGSIAAGGSSTITVVLRPTVAGRLTNTAVVAADQVDPLPTNNTTTVTAQVTPLPGPDLAVSGAATPCSVVLGDEVSYAFSVANSGTRPATGVILTGGIPSSGQYVSSSTTQGNVSVTSSSVIAQLGSLAVGSSATVTIVLRPESVGTHSCSASAAADQTDTEMGNNSATVTTDVTPPPSADLCVSGYGNPTIVAVGSETSYGFSVVNYGPKQATRVTLTSAIPSGCAYISSSTTRGVVSFTSGTVIAQLGSLAAGSSARVAIVLRPDVVGTLSCTASVSADLTDPYLANNSTTVTTSVIPPPSADLCVSGSGNPTIVAVGSETSYRFSVVNYGPRQATRVTLTSAVPSGCAFISSSTTRGAVSVTSGTVIAQLGSLAAGSSARVTIVLRPDAVGTLSCCASVSADQTDPYLANNSTTATTSVTLRLPDLVVSGSSDPSEVIVGEQVSHAFSVANSGPLQATGVRLTNVIPAGCTYVSSSTTSGSVAFENGVVTAQLGSLALGSSVTVMIVLRPDVVGTLSCTASASADQTDIRTDDNSATVTTSVTPLPRPDLVVSGSGDPSEMVIGGQVSCTFTVANSGPANATGVRLTSLIPSGCTYVSSSTTQGTVSVTSDTVVAQLGALATASSATVTIVLHPDVVGTLSCTALVSSDQTDRRIDDNSATVTISVIPVPRPDLIVTGSGDPSAVVVGGQVSYTLTVANSGPGQATGVRLTSAIPSGCTYVSSSTTQGSVVFESGAVTAQLGSLAAGSSATVTIVLRPDVVGTLSCNASASADQTDRRTDDNSATVTTSVTPVPRPDLVVTGSGDPSAVVAGGQVSCTFTVVNSGPGQATGVRLTSAIPSGCTYVSSSTTLGSVAAEEGMVTARLGALAPGSSATVTIVLRPDVVGTLSCTASASSDQTDLHTGDNSATVTTSVTPPPSADLVVSGSGNPSAVVVGGQVSYAFSVMNRGPGQATQVILTSAVPSGCTYVSSSTTQGSVSLSSGTVTAQLSSLAAGSSATVTIVLRPDIAGTLSCTASASADQTDPNLANNSATVSTTVTPAFGPDLSGSWSGVSQSTRTSRTGSVCTVKGRLTVSNRGNQDAARSVVRVYLSDTTSVAPGSAPIKTINVQKLRTGRSTSYSLSVRLPSGVQASGKYLVAILDADGVLSEMNESNNVVTWGRF